MAEYFNYFLASVNWPTVIVLSLIIIPVTDTLFRMIASKVRSGLRAEREDHQDLRLKYCCLEDQMRELRLENLALSQISTDIQNLSGPGNHSAPLERAHPLSGKKTLTKPGMTDIDDEVIDIIVVRDLFDDRGENGLDAIQEQPEERQEEVIDLISVRDLFNDDNDVVALPDQYETEISIGESADILTARDEPEVDITAEFDLTGEFEVVKSDEIADLPTFEDEPDVDNARVFKLIDENDVVKGGEIAGLPTFEDEPDVDNVRVFKLIDENDVVKGGEIAGLPTFLDEPDVDTATVFNLLAESDLVKGDETADAQTGSDEAAKGDTEEICTLADAEIHGDDLDTEPPALEDASRDNDDADAQTDGHEAAKGDTEEMCTLADAEIHGDDLDTEPRALEDASHDNDDDDAAMERVAEQVIEPVSASTEEAATTPNGSDVTDQRNGEANGEAGEQDSTQDLQDDEVGLIKLTDEERAILIAISKQRLDGVSSSGIIGSQRVQLAVNRLKDDGLIDEMDDELVDSAAGQRWLDSRDSH